ANHFAARRTISLPRRGTAETQFSLEDGRSWPKPYISPSLQSGFALLAGPDGLVLATNELDHIVLLSTTTGEVLTRIETPEGNKRTFLALDLGGDLGKVVLSALDAQRSNPEVLIVRAGAQPKELWRWKGPATDFEQSAGLAVAVLTPEGSAMPTIA